MYPTGHARCENDQLPSLLDTKFTRLLDGAVDDVGRFLSSHSGLNEKTPEEVRRLYGNFELD
jgi:hypothetical protein